MKKFLRLVCMTLIMSLLFVIPAYADSAVEPRGSAFFAAYWMDLYKASDTSFEIWFDVNANATMMDELGVCEIIVYQSSDQQSWTEVATYNMEDYPEMIDTYTLSHTGYVTYYNAIPGYYYRACIFFYAKNSLGIGMRDFYTEILRM